MKCLTDLFIPIFLLTSCALSSAGSPFTVQSEKEAFIVTAVAENLERPWSLAFLPDNGGYLITERTGNLLLIRDGRTSIVTGTPRAAVVGQGGLLDVVLSPSFTADSLVYLSFAEESGGIYGTAVARGRLIHDVGGNARLVDTEVIYRALPKSSGGRHFGSRLVFDEDGYLYVTLGERGSMNRAQDTSDPYGSVLRLNPDGSVPGDNLLVGGSDAAEIWSYGHRNAQGMARHPGTGDIWLHEHGPKGGDEVNIVRKGANYGWPTVTYGIDYDGSVISDTTTAAGVEDALICWVPSIAPSGMAFYVGNAFPGWRGDIFVGTLAGKHLRRLELRGNEVVHQEILLQGRLGRIRDVRAGPDGFIYLLSDADNGALYRIEPARE